MRKSLVDKHIDTQTIIKKNNLDLKDLNGSGEDGKITKNDVLEMINNSSKVTGREYTSKKMSSLRRKIATRLVAVKNETAMLTTFNEVDMSSIMTFIFLCEVLK